MYDSNLQRYRDLWWVISSCVLNMVYKHIWLVTLFFLWNSKCGARWIIFSYAIFECHLWQNTLFLCLIVNAFITVMGISQLKISQNKSFFILWRIYSHLFPAFFLSELLNLFWKQNIACKFTQMSWNHLLKTEKNIFLLSVWKNLYNLWTNEKALYVAAMELIEMFK